MNAAAIIARCTMLPLHRRHHPTTTIYNISLRSLASSTNPPPLRHRHTNNRPRRPLPIAAFVDLDNVTPKTFRRSDAKSFIGPLIEFERHVNNDNIDDNVSKTTQLLRIEAFGNLNTRSWRGKEEKEHDVTKQEYIPWRDFDENDGDNNSHGQQKKQGGGMAQTGLDTKGVLRCGICGSKMKLTKKDKKRPNFTVYDKLKTHMKIHTSEQRKRQITIKQQKDKNKNKAAHNQKPLLDRTDRKKFQKYEAATVGLTSIKQVSVDGSGRAKYAERNDLFRVLREVGVRVKAEDDVDAALIRAAEKWMQEVDRGRGNNNKREEDGGDGEEQHHEQENDDDYYNDDNTNYKGVLVVYSKDGDFIPLLKHAKKKGFLAVSATDSARQTEGLLRSTDVVLGPFGRWMEDDSMEEVKAGTGCSTTTSAGFNQKAAGSSISYQDENDEEVYDIREVSSAPTLSLLSKSASSSSSDGGDDDDSSSAGMLAIPISEDGFRFMNERRQEQEQEGMKGALSNNVRDGLFQRSGVGVDNSVRWHLSTKDPSDVDEMNTDGGSTTTMSDDTSNDNEMEKNNVSIGKQMTTLIASAFQTFMPDAVESSTSSEKTKEQHNDGDDPKFRKRQYKCNACGHESKKWRKFKNHQRFCTQCTPERRQWPMKKFSVYLEDDDSSMIDNDNNSSSDSTGDGGEVAKQETKEQNDDDDGNDHRNMKRRYKCNECKHQEKKWGDFKKYQRNCTSCTPKNRKLAMKKFIVYLEDDGSTIDHATFISGYAEGAGILPEMYVRKNTADGIDMYVWKNNTTDENGDKKKIKRRMKLKYQCKDCGHETKLWRTLKAHMRKNCSRCNPDYDEIRRKKYEVYRPVVD